MKRMMPWVAAGVMACAMAACGGKKDSDTIVTTKVETKKPAAPVRMQDYEQTREVELEGSFLACTIRRSPDDSLALVTDESGQKFVDNRIDLVIKRRDGSEFFRKSFTKKTFSEYLDDDYRQTGILEGLVFDRVDGSRLRFAASVSHPQTDEYIPLVVIVSRTGAMSIERDTQLDTSGEEEKL